LSWMRTLAVVGWTCFIHSCTLVMAYYIFLKEHECILPTLRLVCTFLPSLLMGFLRLYTPGISFSCALGSHSIAEIFSSCVCQLYSYM
jgi:hypothetical protein